MPVLTKIIGSIVKPDGTQVTSGNLYLSLLKDFKSIDGNRVTAFSKTYEITGDLDLSLFATENTVAGSSYTDLSPGLVWYDMVFDPDPTDTTIPINRKSGSFKHSLSVPHVSDTALLNEYSFGVETGPTQIKTRITGDLIKPDGSVISSGSLYISINSAFTAIDGNFVAPFMITYPVTGTLSIDLFATLNSVAGSAYTALNDQTIQYTMEYDPTPDDETIPYTRKDGHFRNTFSLNHVSDTALNNTIDIANVLTLESQHVQKKYGNKNILDNDPRLLTPAQKTTLTSGSADADGLHTHAGVDETMIVLEEIADPGSVDTNKAKIYLSDGIIATKTAIGIKLENDEVVTLFYV